MNLKDIFSPQAVAPEVVLERLKKESEAAKARVEAAQKLLEIKKTADGLRKEIKDSNTKAKRFLKEAKGFGVSNRVLGYIVVVVCVLLLIIAIKC